MDLSEKRISFQQYYFGESKQLRKLNIESGVYLFV